MVNEKIEYLENEILKIKNGIKEDKKKIKVIDKINELEYSDELQEEKDYLLDEIDRAKAKIKEYKSLIKYYKKLI